MAHAEANLAPERVQRNLALHRAAEKGDLEQCKLLLLPDAQNPTTRDGQTGAADIWFADDATLGWDALHFASDAGHLDVVKLLLKHGALWNAVDHLGFTAADVAWSRNYTKVYDVLFQEGVRQSFLVNVIKRKTAEVTDELSEPMPEDHGQESHYIAGKSLTLVSGSQNEVNYSNKAFLQSPLEFICDERGQWRCLDQDKNMVMAEWEDEIMHESAKQLCEGQPEGFSILNIGFGLGIIDEAIQAYKPGRHVIIEPHPDAIAFMRARGWDQRHGVEIFEGTWEQFMMPEHDEDGAFAARLGDFDAIYYDTYSQDYNDLRTFFECLPNVLSGPDARFSFFHGLAATNTFLYNVYTRVAELDLHEIGFETEWTTLCPTVTEDDWQGVKRKYWTLDQYYLPLSHMRLV